MHASRRCRRASAALDAVARLRKAADTLLVALATSPDRAMAVSVPFLKLCGFAIGGWLMARAADIAAQQARCRRSDREFFEAKLATRAFLRARRCCQQVLALEQIVSHGSDAVVGTDAALI